MAVQASAAVTNIPFILGGPAYQTQAATVVRDQTRSGPIVFGTVMCLDNSTGKWTPFTEVAGATGQNLPAGIILQELGHDAVEAADQTNVKILIGGALVDKNQIVLENSLTLATVVTVSSAGAATSAGKLDCYATVEQILRWHGIFVSDSIVVAGTEN